MREMRTGCACPNLLKEQPPPLAAHPRSASWLRCHAHSSGNTTSRPHSPRSKVIVGANAADGAAVKGLI